MIKKRDLSQDDKKNWEKYIKNPTDIYDKEIKNSDTKNNETFKFDLHGFSLNDATTKVRDLVFHCVQQKYKHILLITGTGIHSSNDKDVYSSKDLSKLRYSVPDFLNNNDQLQKFITSIDKVDKKDGGEGAILIKLKKL